MVRYCFSLVAFAFVSNLILSQAFLPGSSYGSRSEMKTSALFAMGSKTFRINISLPKESGTKEEILLFEPILKDRSKIIEVRYEIPYSLDVEQNEVTGLPTW